MMHDRPFVQRNIRDARAAPERDFAIAMLAGDICMNVLHRNIQSLPIRNRNRELSNTVPDPNTRPAGNPHIFCVM